jgi:hypothetical protein
VPREDWMMIGRIRSLLFATKTQGPRERDGSGRIRGKECETLLIVAETRRRSGRERHPFAANHRAIPAVARDAFPSAPSA